MTDRAEIERLLQMTGRTLEGLPERYSMAEREAAYKRYRTGDYVADHILHQSDVIELLIGALRDALEAAQTRWNSVEERLPEKLNENNQVYITEEVIGFDGECAYIGQYKVYKHDGYRTFFDGNFFRDDITHWMQLPEPPKEGE